MVGRTGGEGICVVAEEIAEIEGVRNRFYDSDLSGLWCLMLGPASLRGSYGLSGLFDIPSECGAIVACSAAMIESNSTHDS